MYLVYVTYTRMFFGKKKKKVLLFALVVTIMSNKAFPSSYFIRDNRNIRFAQLTTEGDLTNEFPKINQVGSN